jgi:transposase
MQKNNKPKSASFKADAVQLYKSLGSYEKAAAQAGISISSLHRWVAQHEASTPQEPSSKHDALEQEVERLRKENKRLLMERDILKKAAAFFAKENS